MAEGDPRLINYLRLMPVVDFYALLERRNNDVIKQNKEIEKQQQKLKK